MNALIAVAELIDRGGPLLPALFAAAVLLFMLTFERYVELWWAWPRLRKRLVAAWNARGDRQSVPAHRVREALISEARLRLEATLPVLAAMVAICPLLGLLGTVTGMMIALPGLFFLTRLRARARRAVDAFADQLDFH